MRQSAEQQVQAEVPHEGAHGAEESAVQHLRDQVQGERVPNQARLGAARNQEGRHRREYELGQRMTARPKND